MHRASSGKPLKGKNITIHDDRRVRVRRHEVGVRIQRQTEMVGRGDMSDAGCEEKDDEERLSDYLANRESDAKTR